MIRCRSRYYFLRLSSLPKQNKTRRSKLRELEDSGAKMSTGRSNNMIRSQPGWHQRFAQLRGRSHLQLRLSNGRGNYTNVQLSSYRTVYYKAAASPPRVCHPTISKSNSLREPDVDPTFERTYTQYRLSTPRISSQADA